MLCSRHACARRLEMLRMSERSYSVLFLCTGNSARSILAEALLNRNGAGRFRAFSAGSFPNGAVHPMALQVLGENDFPTDGLRSKSWDEFAGPKASPIDLVITVCDNAAHEVCPIWPGGPVTAHWGIEDPAAVARAGQRQAFLTTLHSLDSRIAAFLALPVEGMDGASLRACLSDIGCMKDAGLA